MAETAVPQNAAVAPTAATAGNKPGTTAVGTKSAATPVIEAPKSPAVDDNQLLRQLTKASAAERKANQMVTELKTKLEAATGSATETQQKAALLEDIKKNPRKLLDLGITWDQILESIQGKEQEPENPKVTEMQKRLDALEAERQKEKDDAKRKTEEETTASQKREIERGRQQIADIIAKDGATIDSEGFPRWAIVSQDTAASVEIVMNGVIEFITEQHKASAAKGEKFTITDTEAYELARQGLDQLEKRERAKLNPLLKIVRETSSVSIDKAKATTQPITAPRQELPPKRVTVERSAPRKTIFPSTNSRG